MILSDTTSLAKQKHQIDKNSILQRTFDLSEVYRSLHNAYMERGVAADLDPNDKEHTFDAEWKIPHYFETGSDAIRVIVNALISNLKDPPKKLLDFPCGSGRVTRHMKSFFPEADVTACDLYDYHVNFCRDIIGAKGVMSRANLNEVDFGDKFDVIFCGSLLTHLPEREFMDAVRLIASSLSDTGIAVVTTQGRYAEFVQKNKYKVIEDDLFEVALSTVPETGFGYVNYNHKFMTETWNKQDQYGVTISRPHWLMKQLEDMQQIRIMDYSERGWDATQDVVVFGKPGVNAWMRSGDVVI
ncbi:class I SAM-dependent methyltransferase [Sphingomonas sp. MMS24-J13]|uniref:class I SAM-dependent methyltransferase n=1 Tax=Sphingomonas sp. MMS24-J13 TaxID=3238686 RepID=UPI00384C6645